jgi:hypothetical protein
MALSLYDASVANYLQTLGAVGGFLERGLKHFRDSNIDPETIVEARLTPDMLPLRFQIISVAQHSRGAIEAAQNSRRGWMPPPFATSWIGNAGCLRTAARHARVRGDNCGSGSHNCTKRSGGRPRSGEPKAKKSI